MTKKKIIKARMLMQKIGGRWIPCPTDNPFLTRQRGVAARLWEEEVWGKEECRKLIHVEIHLPPPKAKKK